MEWWYETERVILQFFMHYPPLILLAELLFCIKAPRRKYFWARFIPSVLVYFALPYFVGYQVPWLVAGWFSFSFLLYFILSMGIIWLCFDFSWQKVLYFCTAAYAIEHLFDSVQRATLNVNLMGSEHYSVWIYLAILACVYVVSYFIFVRNIIKLDAALVKNLYVYSVSLITVSLVNVMSQWMQYVGYTVLDKVYDALVCLLLLFLQYGLVHIAGLVKKNIAMEDVINKENAQHKLSAQNMEQLNIKCHDLKHQINAMMETADAKDKQQMLADVNNVIGVYDSMFETGNVTLDVILTEKKLLCSQEDITFLCMADGKALSFMSPVDISSLFGNALSNAIESVRSQSDKTKRHIDMKIVKHNNLITVNIENYCDKKLAFADGLPVTDKEDKNSHGFGVKSIRNVVEKYGGHMCIETVNNTYKLDILFSATTVAA